MTNEAKVLTVKEAIDYAIDNGIEQAEKQLEFWNKYNRLMKDNAKSLERSLLQLHETVEFDGYGKRGKVYLGKKYSEIQERIEGRKNNGHRTSGTENYFEEMLHKKLTMIGNGDYTLGGWINKIGLPQYKINPYGQQFMDMQNKIRASYKLYESSDAPFFNSYTVVFEFMADYNQKVKNLLANSLKRLERKGKIKFEEKTKALTKSDSVKEIEADEYKAFRDFQTKLIKESGLTFKQYHKKIYEADAYKRLDSGGKIKAKGGSNKINKAVKLVEEIEEALLEEFGYKFVFKSYFVEDIQEILDGEWTDLEREGVFPFGNVCDTHYLESTKIYKFERNKEYYAESTYFFRRFFFLSTAILLEDHATVNQLMTTFEEDLKEYIRDFDVNYYLIEVEQAEVFGEQQFIEYSDQLRADFYKKRNDSNVEAEKVATRELAKYEVELDIEQAVEIEAVYDAPQDVQSDYRNFAWEGIGYHSNAIQGVDEDIELINMLFG